MLYVTVHEIYTRTEKMNGRNGKRREDADDGGKSKEKY